MKLSIRTFLAGTALCAAFSATALAADTSASEFDIKSAPLARALAQFARQADVSVVLPRLSYRDGKARAVTGAFTADAALASLLEGSDFTFEKLPSGAYRVVRRPPAPAQPVVAEASAFQPTPIEEILVSSTRRIEAVQKLPYSISAFSGGLMSDLQATKTADVTRYAASLGGTNMGRGRNKLIVRGLSDGAFSGSTQALVATYLDYTRLTYNAPEPGLGLYDVEQIEFLRGPQGTLYGSGALGGLYRVVTRKPEFGTSEFSATAQLSAGEHGNVSTALSGVANLPFGETTALRLVAYHEREGGFIDDTRLGRSNADDAVTTGGRAALAFKPADNWTVTLGAVVQHHDADDTHYYNAALGTYVRDNYLAEPFSDRFLQIVGRLDIDFGWGDLVSSTAWMKRDLGSTLDATRAIPRLTGLDTLVPSLFVEDRDISTFASEVHLASKTGGRFEWLAGAFWSHRDATLDTSITMPGSAGLGGLGPTDTLYSESLFDDMTESAVFGELTYYFTEKLALTVGARLFVYDISASTVLDDIGPGALRMGTGDQHDVGVTPKFALAWHASDKTLVYLQGSEGYRVGGINLDGPSAVGDGEEVDDEEAQEHALLNFVPDRTINLELGAKLTRMGDRLTVNGAFFHTWWRDMQSDQFADTGLPVIGNIGNARNFGVELEASYRPSPAWQMRVNIGWNHSELTGATTDFGASLGAEGSVHLPGAPSFSAGGMLSYSWDIGTAWRATAVADYSYTGASTLLFNEENARGIEAYHLINTRLDFHSGRWSVRLFADNLLDSHANSFAFGNPFSLADMSQITPLRPRTIGVELGWSF